MGLKTVLLIESTPHRLRYLVTSDDLDTRSFGVGTIPNANAGSYPLTTTPDLRSDSQNAGPSFTPMNKIMRTGVANQAAARKLLDGQTLILPADIDTPRTHLSIVPVQSEISGWGVDANEGAAAGDITSAGFAVVVIQTPNVDDAQAIVDITFAHTENR
jgi:hypothetical protein